jgi:hypothetical protein
MKNMMLVVCLGMCVAAGGCGSGKVVSAANNVVMKGGQWEYVVTPDNGGITMDIDANVPGTNLQFNGTNALIFHPSQVGATTPSAAPLYCSAFAFNGEININIVKGNFDWGETTQQFGNFSGELSADGQSITNGTYSGQACTVSNGSGNPGPNFKGTFTGYAVAPVNGTYSGKLQSSLYGADVVTFVITQNADFSLNMSGTSVENGVTSTLAPSTLAETNVVNGATVYLGGTTENVNGTGNFSFAGHLNPTATQLTITLMSFGPNETVTGTLTRQ